MSLKKGAVPLTGLLPGVLNLNRKQIGILLLGIAGLTFVIWECFRPDFPLTDSSQIENTRIRLFIFFCIVICATTGVLFWGARTRKK